jgi:hypothetical protein
MIINIENKTIEFKTIQIEIKDRNQENIFQGNNRTLYYKLNKAISKPTDRLHIIAKQQMEKYKLNLEMRFGDFLSKLKKEKNNDYKLYLNKYGDGKFCNYKITNYHYDKGIYCYIIEDRIVYIGRSKKTFSERFKDYGKITPYNCLIDGQATNCNINSKVNELKSITVGFYLMNYSSDKEIEDLEKKIINNLKNGQNLWNIQQS